MGIEQLKAAADDIVAAALLGDGWEAALSCLRRPPVPTAR